jgi:hypothetical protein
MSVNPIWKHPRAAFKQQKSMEWTNIYKGRLSHKWQQLTTMHVHSKLLDLRAQEWCPKFVTATWDHSLRIWQFRNDTLHADTNAQVKHYKLEELENSNHYFIFININILIHQIWSTDYDTKVKSAGQLLPNSFSTKPNLDSHQHTMN